MSSKKPEFRGFDPHGELTIYVRNLPHWRQPGATYFVTMRQADSIPAAVLRMWKEERFRWLRARGIEPAWAELRPRRFAEAYRRIPENARRVFEKEQARQLHRELDECSGFCALRFAEVQQIVMDSLQYGDSTRIWLGDAVIMPNHVHAIMQPLGDSKLELVLGSIKRWTSRQIREWLKSQPESVKTGMDDSTGLWQHESYDRIIRDGDELSCYRRYIHTNPDSAGISVDPYGYHAAEWLDRFAERPGLALLGQ